MLKNHYAEDDALEPSQNGCASHEQGSRKSPPHIWV
jgi:hypothetical protein